jgi:hypothetical protein
MSTVLEAEVVEPEVAERQVLEPQAATTAETEDDGIPSAVAEAAPSVGGAPKAPAAMPRWHDRATTPACLGVSVAVIVLAIAFSSPAIGVAGMALFAATSVLAVYRALRGIVRLVLPQAVAEGSRSPEAIASLFGNLLMAGVGMLVAYVSTVGFGRGRQLRRLGRLQLPSLRTNADWATEAVAPEGLESAPDGLADQWRENGKTEHASVAAFARLTLDLMALGAPPEIIASAQRDALDEIRHTRLCFSIARGLDGRAESPAPFPQAQRVATLPRPRTLALAKLAVDSLVDGALHEGVSARVVAKLARRCEVSSIRAALREIAADEGRHAAHGWAVVEWCLDEGGRQVAHALIGATRALPATVSSALPEAAADGGWERWGIHGRDLESQEYAAARAHVIERVRRRVAAAPSSIAPLSVSRLSRTTFDQRAKGLTTRRSPKVWPCEMSSVKRVATPAESAAWTTSASQNDNWKRSSSSTASRIESPVFSTTSQRR